MMCAERDEALRWWPRPNGGCKWVECASLAMEGSLSGDDASGDLISTEFSSVSIWLAGKGFAIYTRSTPKKL